MSGTAGKGAMNRFGPMYGAFGLLYIFVALIGLVAFVWVAVLLIQFLTLKNRQLRAKLDRGEFGRGDPGRWGHRSHGGGRPAEWSGQRWPGEQPRQPGEHPGQQQPPGAPGQQQPPGAPGRAPDV